MKVAIIFGSPSDTPVMKKAAQVLRELDVDYVAQVLSAHRTPELLQEIVKKLESQGTEVIIAGAGLAAHLPGLIAGLTLIPVIGVPINSGGLGGMDALLSMVQMPRPIPVAVVGVDNGANAAYLACQVLGLKYPDLQARLVAFRAAMKADFAGNTEKVEL
ncbi:MAG: 5-(carboxyamino)imidazole ribonucleotide mutase [Treponema sp.]|jgi:5-(carboxyamino)imidazole ribonucleotide mutase|nr:5-(carboxyamino)imidazole ribonucleotide mutase [Treponema sp.]